MAFEEINNIRDLVKWLVWAQWAQWAQLHPKISKNGDFATTYFNERLF